MSGLLSVGGVSLGCHFEWEGGGGGTGVSHLRLISAVKKDVYEEFLIPLELNT